MPKNFWSPTFTFILQSGSEPMNAAAYLQRQGWRGHGHSLDEGNRGLAKPILVSHKTDSAGLGKKKNDFEDQWWLRVWDAKPAGANGEVRLPAVYYSVSSI